MEKVINKINDIEDLKNTFQKKNVLKINNFLKEEF